MQGLARLGTPSHPRHAVRWTQVPTAAGGRGSRCRKGILSPLCPISTPGRGASEPHISSLGLKGCGQVRIAGPRAFFTQTDVPDLLGSQAALRF